MTGELKLIKKANELRIKYDTNLKDGVGTVKAINFLEEAESNGAGRLFAVSIIPVGGSIGYHQHTGDNEVYYLLKGKAKVVDNGKEEILESGDSIVCFDGDFHGIENVGNCDLEYISIILYTEQKK